MPAASACNSDVPGLEASAAPAAGSMAPRFQRALPGRRLIVVSNRQPYEHRVAEEVDEVEVQRPAGGLTSALDPVLQGLGGVWIAWGSGDADREVVDGRDHVGVPPEDPRYVLRRLWLDKRDILNYYLGFSNQFLWPLCHLRPALTRIRRRHWEHYRAVNGRFAAAVVEEAGSAPVAVWFQDYHLSLAPALVRQQLPAAQLAHFWHIPWPPVELFRIAPHADELLRGLLANELLGFHLPLYVENFLACARHVLGAEVDAVAGTARLDGHTCHVRAFPISIDVERFAAAAAAPGVPAQVERLRQRYAPHGRQLGLGVDRLDYSKGIPERIKALDFLWHEHPALREQFSFVQIAVPSRTDIDDYDELSHKVERLVWEVNDRHGTGDWQPIHLVKRSLPLERLAVFYRAADLCVVSSLVDGMNLVAKEYVACQRDGAGVLLLSRFAGAVEEMDGCIELNPYDPEGFADELARALTLPEAERRARMQRLQRSLRTIFDWMAEIFDAWAAVAPAAAPGPPLR
jgi:alpha,alpha-trehalose-phosphate synthase [UDP-forming]